MANTEYYFVEEKIPKAFRSNGHYCTEFNTSLMLLMFPGIDTGDILYQDTLLVLVPVPLTRNNLGSWGTGQAINVKVAHQAVERRRDMDGMN